MSNSTICNSDVSAENESDIYDKIFEYRTQFQNKVAENFDLLMFWNPLTNKEIIRSGDRIDEFSILAEEASTNADVFIHLGEQWLKQHEHHKLYKRTCGRFFHPDTDFFPSRNNFLEQSMIKKLYYLLIKPHIVLYQGNMMDGRLELYFLDNANEDYLLVDYDPARSDLVSCVVKYGIIDE